MLTSCLDSPHFTPRHTHTQRNSFCLICNYVSKIIPALQSRCTRFRFAPLAPQHVEDRIHYVAQREK